MEILNAYVRFTVDDSGLKSGLQDAVDTAKSAGNDISAGTVAAGAIIADLVRKGASTIFSLAKQGVEYNAQIETYTAAITTALGGTAEAAQEAEAAIAAIKHDAAVTPFSVDGLVQANQYLMAAGINANDARETIMALSDAVSASGGGNAELQRMAQNLQQIKNTGKATAMDIRQFANAGINVYGVLADYTGMTTEEVQNLTVTYDLLNNALKAASAEGGRYFEANLKQSQTLNGQISTLQDNVSQKLGEAFEGIAETLSSKILPAVNDFVQNLDVDEAVTSVGSLMAALAGFAVTMNSKAIWGKLTEWATTLASPIGIAAASVAAVSAAAVAGSREMDRYVDSMAEVGETSDDVQAQMQKLALEIDELREAEKLYGTDNTYEIDSKSIAIQKLSERYAELQEAETLALAVQGDETAALSVTNEQLAMLAENYAATYDAMAQSVEKFYGMFEDASKRQTTTIDQMIANLNSQQDAYIEYADSLAIISTSGIEGVDELTATLAAGGKEGAMYAKAMADAIAAGDYSKVEELVNAWNGVQAAQEQLTGALAQTQAAFTDLATAAGNDIQRIQTALNQLDGRHIKIYYDGYKQGEHVNGSFAVGLSYVPFDGYVAELHKGERVLTAAENRAYNENGGVTGNGVTIVQNISATPQTPVQLAAATAAYFEQARWSI